MLLCTYHVLTTLMSSLRPLLPCLLLPLNSLSPLLHSYVGFMSRAKDQETGRIYYEDYVALLVAELEHDPSEEGMKK